VIELRRLMRQRFLFPSSAHIIELTCTQRAGAAGKRSPSCGAGTVRADNAAALLRHDQPIETFEEDFRPEPLARADKLNHSRC
jgi:hypothetical protein